MANDNVYTRDSTSLKLFIPDYQRPYKWTVSNVSRLIDDIAEAHSNNCSIYRIGTLILNKNKNDGYDIVDGQQRTITLFLIINAFMKKYSNLSDNSFKKNFNNLKIPNNAINKYNLIHNNMSIERRIDKFEENLSFYQYLLNNCELIVVITDKLSETFQFFDSQNTRGKKLYPHDLLKAYHLREMNNYELDEIIKTVKIWENMEQKTLARLFQEYLYRLKEWMNGNKASELNEKNLYMFKGVTSHDTYPYSQFYKAAYSYANNVNHSPLQMVMGINKLCSFQLNTPVIAGKPFFEYSKHYYDILHDIQDNSKYEGYFINDNEIVKTLDLDSNKNGTGNKITRLIFDTAILLYVDRFCPEIPNRIDLSLLDNFVIYAFIWAYSMRAQYKNVGWLVAQNFIMGEPAKENIKNALNIFKLINDSESPTILLNRLSEKLEPINWDDCPSKNSKENSANLDEQDQEKIFKNYLHFFIEHKYLLNYKQKR